MRREWIKSLSKVAYQFGAVDHWIEEGGKHPRFLVRVQSGLVICHPFPSTPSDYRSLKNASAQLRRALKAVTLCEVPAFLPESAHGLGV